MNENSSHKPSFTDSVSEIQCGHVPSFIHSSKQTFIKSLLCVKYSGDARVTKSKRHNYDFPHFPKDWRQYLDFF